VIAVVAVIVAVVAFLAGVFYQQIADEDRHHPGR
jgi:hypothetical protein